MLLSFCGELRTYLNGGCVSVNLSCDTLVNGWLWAGLPVGLFEFLYLPTRLQYHFDIVTN
jgi:hypothetical protein